MLCSAIPTDQNGNLTPAKKSTLNAQFEGKRFSRKHINEILLRHTGAIPIDRQHADTSWIRESLKVLKEDKEHIVIYPEGRHGEHRKQLPFHSGVTMLTAIAQVPIVMIYQDGPVQKYKRNKLIIAPPFRLTPPEKGISADYVEEQTALLQDKMKDLMQAFIEMDES